MAEEAAGDREGLADPPASWCLAGPTTWRTRSSPRWPAARWACCPATVRGPVHPVRGRGRRARRRRGRGRTPRPRCCSTRSAGDPTALSYLVASAALLTTEDRQALLAESATRRRLAAESRLLRRELTLLQTLGAVPVPLQQFAAPMTVN